MKTKNQKIPVEGSGTTEANHGEGVYTFYPEQNKEAFYTVGIHRITEVTGEVSDDGADTREYITSWHVVADNDEDGERFGDYLVSLWEIQDYSYSAGHEEIIKRLSWSDIVPLRDALNEFIRQHPEIERQ